jgi:hypothetical protein
VISDEDKRDFVMGLGAKGVINRKDFNCWGQLPKVNTPEYKEWFTEARKFGKAIWDITGKGVNVDMVFEHPGEATFPVSTFVCKKGGMVVICAGTTGLQLHLRRALHVDAPESACRAPISRISSRRLGQQADDRAPSRPLHVRGLPVGGTSPGASEDAPQRAQAGATWRCWCRRRPRDIWRPTTFHLNPKGRR